MYVDPDDLPPEQAIALHIIKNSFGIDLNTTLHRIFREDYLLNDIKNDQITLACPSPGTQGDRYENVLLNHRFDFEGHKIPLLRSLMSNYYCQSWSKRILPWKYFNPGHKEIRIRTTVGKLFSSMMRLEDLFHMLNYYISEVKYEDTAIINNSVNTRVIDDYLDGQGIELVSTVLRIKSDHSIEEEVRLVYHRGVQEDNPWISNNTSIFQVPGIGGYCVHPLIWRDIIDELIVDPTFTMVEIENIKRILINKGTLVIPKQN